MMNPKNLPDANILSEQFIPDHVFIYVKKGTIQFYDGNKNYTFKSGEFCIGRKNRLARYKIEKTDDGFELIFICLEEAFLKHFQEKHEAEAVEFNAPATFIKIRNTELLQNYIHSLKAYYNEAMQVSEAFEAVKHEELLIILLQNQPELAGIFFNYRILGKIDIEEFMNKNFKFNVSIGRFAFLTGRSLSAFKRDFQRTYNTTPSHWLVQKRLEEAHYLINRKNEKPSDIYLDLGFEDLSHFSYAFKKLFGHPPSEGQKKKI